MSLNPSFLQHINETFTSFFKEDTQVMEVSRVEGGDINQTFVLLTSKGKFFLKLNSALFGHDFFEKEARGLATLANAGALKVPRPLFDGKFHQQIYLVMEFLEKGSATTDFWTDFGTSMASLHRHSADEFGLEYNNFIGKIHQQNNRCSSWSEFYTTQRIMPLANKALKQKMLQQEDISNAEHLCSKLSGIMPEEKPSLLHGDLWKGNFMVSDSGHTAIFDPAVYYGHREMDLAMTKLFGGFDESFYQAYHEAYPLQPGFEDRTEILQLYPLLVHLLLFGGPYYQSVRNILEKFR
jgi:fructosamine-3-kinase